MISSGILEQGFVLFFPQLGLSGQRSPHREGGLCEKNTKEVWGGGKAVGCLREALYREQQCRSPKIPKWDWNRGREGMRGDEIRKVTDHIWQDSPLDSFDFTLRWGAMTGFEPEDWHLTCILKGLHWLLSWGKIQKNNGRSSETTQML